MPIFELFTKRMAKLEKAGKPDVYQYTSLPKPFRVQVVHIWSEALGTGIDYSGREDVWRLIRRIMLKEKGVFALTDEFTGREYREDCAQYVLQADTGHALDLIELSFRAAETVSKNWQRHDLSNANITVSAEAAIEELNERFREHQIGYQYESGKIMRVDSAYVHAEAVIPALVLLADQRFEGPNKEFLAAHKHYRRGEHEAALTEALKAFESTMKAICDARKWPYNPTDTASKLIAVLFNNKLLPDYLQSEVTGVRTTLECGVPTLRNKSGGHGAGATPRVVPAYFASYALHLTATNIVLLVEAHKALK